MSELFINKARALAVTGHRVVEAEFNKNKLKKIFIKLIDDGFDTFLIGMAIGFDTFCFQILQKLKKKYDNIKLIACIPCLNQSYKFNEQQKKEYDKMVKAADEKIILSNEYTSTCMQKRNKFMVDNASILLAYLRHDFGGTFKTVNYAKKVGVPVINV